MLSILIPTYNYNITFLVESLLKELNSYTFSYEILVLDDCSTNEKIVKANQRISNLPNCIYSQNPTNLGRTATRQALAEKANYDRLLFMDADVLPESTNFINNFNIEQQTADVVFGGITYESKKPEKDKILRWKYGKAREAKPVSERNKIPHLSIISQCFLIKKEVFKKANSYLENSYGVDVLFAQNLEKLNATVLHIDNPIIHLGLENNKSFIKKTINGLKSLIFFEKENMIPDNYRPIQKAYLSLKNKGALKLFIKVIAFFEKSIYKNLTSSSPSLFLFDLYKLYYFALLHNNLKPQTRN